MDVLQSSVQPEVPLVETITAAPIAALKPAETYLVEEEVTVPDVVDLKTESESSLFFGGSANVDVLQSSVQPETEGPVAETEEPVVETETPVVKPVEKLAIEADTVLEALNNSVDSAASKAKHANGYWIEVSGDRDVLVKYHA